MREMTGLSGRVSTKLTAAVVSLLAIFAVGAFSASSAQAAPGDPFQADFNYVGLNVGVSIVGEVNEMVLTPLSEDGDGNLLGDLSMIGTYDDNAGNFTLPKEGGLDFPPISLDLGDGIVIDGSIGLTTPAKGNYNAATGAMTVDPSISLTLSVADVAALPEPVGSLGSGPLSCEFAPLNVALSTNPTNWPAPGKVFENPGTLTEGALAGGWNTKPKVKSLIEGNATLCNIIGGFLDPVGGLWMANSAAVIAALPDPTGAKLDPKPCPAGTTGTAGEPDTCKAVVPPKCPTGQTGTPPNCVTPPPAKTPFKVSKVVVTPKKGTVKAGKTIKIKVKVTNSGQTAGVAKVTLKSTNKQVKVPKSVKVSVAAGKSATKTIVVKTTKKAKGKATVVAKSGKASGKSVLSVKAAKKKKRK